MADVIGKRTRNECKELVQTTRKRICETQDIFYITDGLATYEAVLKEEYAIKVLSKKPCSVTTYEGGHKRSSCMVPDEAIMPANIHYAQNIKHRYPDGRLKNVEKRIVWGSVSFLFDTNPIERDNLTRRLNVAKLHRKTLCFAKDKTVLHYQIALDRNMQNFCRTPVPLKQEIPLQERQGKKKYYYRTPAMSIGICNHVWSLQELLTYAVN